MFLGAKDNCGGRMKPEEQLKFKKQYEILADSQLVQMLSDGKDAYVQGAYELLQEEAGRRGIKINDSSPIEEEIKQPEKSPSCAGQPEDNAFVQVMIINCESDQVFIESLLNGTDISYFFQNLGIPRRYIAFPVGLMVDEQRVEEAIELLKDFKPAASFRLW